MSDNNSNYSQNDRGGDDQQRIGVPHGGAEESPFSRRRWDKIATQNLTVDYKHPEVLRRFVTEKGKILPDESPAPARRISADWSGKSRRPDTWPFFHGLRISLEGKINLRRDLAQDTCPGCIRSAAFAAVISGVLLGLGLINAFFLLPLQFIKSRRGASPFVFAALGSLLIGGMFWLLRGPETGDLLVFLPP
jgi:hypothetical protein